MTKNGTSSRNKAWRVSTALLFTLCLQTACFTASVGPRATLQADVEVRDRSLGRLEASHLSQKAEIPSADTTAAAAGTKAGLVVLGIAGAVVIVWVLLRYITYATEGTFAHP